MDTSFTRYSVKVNAPVLANTVNNKKHRDARVGHKTQAATELTEENFAVVTVDLSGQILERIEIAENHISQDLDGNWIIQVPGSPRIDRLIVASLDRPVAIPVTGSIYADPDLLLAATTGAELDLGLGSTAAFKGFIQQLGGRGTFADLNLDIDSPGSLITLQSLVDNIQLAIEDISFTNYATIDEAIQAIQATAEAIAKEEVLNIQNTINANLADAMLNESGIVWFEANQSRVIRTNGETTYSYQNTDFVDVTGHDTRVIQELIWTSGGWRYNPNQFLFATTNNDGSVNINQLTGGAELMAKSLLSFDLSGRNIAEFSEANNLPFELDTSKTFGANAKGFRANINRTNQFYQLALIPGGDNGKCPWDNFNANDFGGNCAREPGHFIDAGPGFNWTEAYQSLRGAMPLLSPDVNHTQIGFRSMIISWEGNISAQFIDNAAKTVRYYQNLDSNNATNTPQGTLIAESTWQEITLTADDHNSQIIAIELPRIVLEKGNFYGATNLIYAEHNGFLRKGFILQPDQVASHFLLLNGTAHADIMAAADHSPN